MTEPENTHPGRWEQLARYLAGESTPEEAAEVRRWLDAHPADAALLDALSAATRDAAAPSAVDTEAALRAVKARPATPSPNRFATGVRRFEMLGAAAAILIVAGIYFVQRYGAEPAVSPEVTYSTGVGKRDSVTLEDGTHVFLAPASRIVVRGRDVTLTGEALFRVTHDAKRPFTVRAQSAVIRDIGTEFSVLSDSTQPEPVRVVVREGAVELTQNAKVVTLRPGDVGVVTRQGDVRAGLGEADAEDVAWASGTIVFRNSTTAAVRGDLRRWFGVELRVSDSALLQRHFSGRFSSVEGARRVLDAIALALPARVQWRGDTAVLRPR